MSKKIIETYVRNPKTGALEKNNIVKGLDAYESAKIGGYDKTETEFYRDLADMETKTEVDEKLDSVKSEFDGATSQLSESITEISNCGIAVPTPLKNGYIDWENGYASDYHDGEKYKRTDFIKIPVSCNSIDINATFAGSAGYALYDDSKVYVRGSADNNLKKEIDVEGCAYVRFSNYDATKVHDISILFRSPLVDGLKNVEDKAQKNEIEIATINKEVGIKANQISVFSDESADAELVNGKVWAYQKQEYAGNNYRYIIYEVNEDAKLRIVGFHYTNSQYRLYAIYDENMKLIDSYYDENIQHSADVIINVPAKAKYIYVNGSKYTQARVYRVSAYRDLEEVERDLTEKIGTQNIVICCTGDSVTEGMATDGAHTADYGKAPYPARLYTILKDNGYDNVTVINQGHGGERCPAIATRIGAFACYLTENVDIPASNTRVSLGTNPDNTIMKIPYPNKNGDDFSVYFTQTVKDTNPLLIDGVEYTLEIEDNTNYIKKTVADGKQTTIGKGSIVLPNDNMNPTVNIFYGGINDGSTLTLQKWLDFMKACGMANGGKYIVLGSTHAFFNYYSDLTGTIEEKYEKYKMACLKEFGVHFIDLYDEFARHALDYALSAGYYKDKSESELATMRQKLADHIIPKEMVYDKAQENNVHLSEEGYHVIGMLLFERLKKLNYI